MRCALPRPLQCVFSQELVKTGPGQATDPATGFNIPMRDGQKLFKVVPFLGVSEFAKSRQALYGGTVFEKGSGRLRSRAFFAL
jgi:hypothetical protein